jgi:hypothetical protein
MPTLPDTGFPAITATLLAAALVLVGGTGTILDLIRDRKRR